MAAREDVKTDVSEAARPVSSEALKQLYLDARTHTAWLPRPVPSEALHQAYDLARMGPTSANGSPARFVFLTTPEAKNRLLPALAPLNVEKTRSAPVTAIIAWDTAFHDLLPRLFPHADMRSYFVGNQPLIDETAFRNGSLQGAYFILAAPCRRTRLRPHVRLRRRQGQRRVFP
jgi:3-hydroxypropanoate dehydrogenase